MTAECHITTQHRVVEGDDKPLTWTLTNGDSTYYDWTGVTKCWFGVYESEHDLDTDALILINSVDNAAQVKIDYPTADLGLVWVEMLAAQTVDLAAKGPLYYEIQVLKNGKLNTLVRGGIVFLHERVKATV